jgi:hypothetical protein
MLKPTMVDGTDLRANSPVEGVRAVPGPLSQRVPKIIHHVWPGDDPFPEMRPGVDVETGSALFHDWRASWLTHHPDWTMMFHRTQPTGDPDVDEVLARDDLTVVVKSDVLRWMVVWQHGGVYTDTDNECLRPLDARWLDAERSVVCSVEPNPWRMTAQGPRPPPCDECQVGDPLQMLSPSLIVARPHAAFARVVLDHLLDTVARTPASVLNFEPHVWTGPLAVTLLWQEHGDLVEALPAWTAYTRGEAPEPHYVDQHWTGRRSRGGWCTVDTFSDGRAVARIAAPARENLAAGRHVEVPRNSHGHVRRFRSHAEFAAFVRTRSRGRGR